MAEMEKPRRIRVSYGLQLRQALLLNLSVMIALGIFLLLGDFLGAAGSFTPLLFLLAGLLITVNFLGYTELALSIPVPGGAYSIIHDREQGGWLAFITGWSLILAGIVSAGLIAQGFGLHTAALLETTLNWSTPPLVWSAGLLFAAALYDVLGSWRQQRGLLMIGLILALLGLLLLGTTVLDFEHFRPSGVNWSTAFSLVLISFIGLEISTSRLNEIRKPTRNIPKIFLFSILLLILLGGLISGLGVGIGQVSLLSGAELPMAALGGYLAGTSGRTAFLVLGLILLIMALNRMLMKIVGQLFTMASHGYWPKALNKYHPRFNTPFRLIALTTALITPTLFLSGDILARTGGLLYLLILMAVNYTLAAEEQMASCPFRLPFHPWIPILVLIIDGICLIFWGPFLALGAGIILAGTLVFLVYSRHHHIEAKEGVTVFKAPAKRETEETNYRVLVPIANPDTAESLLRLAGTLAREKEGEVIALRVITVAHQVPLSEGQRKAASERVLLDRALAQAVEEEFEIQTMTRVSRDISQGILDTAREEDVDKILLGWQAPTRTFGASLGRIIDPVLQNAPCDVLIVKGNHWSEVQRILLPTAGGPNAPLAAELAADFSRLYEAPVTGLFVQVGRATPARMEENRATIEKTFTELEFSQPPEEKVIIAENVVEGVLREAEGHDLILIGASEQGLFDQFAFGSIPQQIVNRTSQTAVMVKRYKGATEFWLGKLWRGLFNLFPSLDLEEQWKLREEMLDDAKPGVNYFVLIILSSIIATLGLLLDSPAVVIGAMLVAPLMSPVLGFSLGIVLGELRLIRLSLESVLKGVIASILVAVIIGLMSPFKDMTTEILSRTQPTLLDLFIALASGMAGAYAISKKDVSAALPGVAIAAALAPPLGVVGLGLALGNPQAAGGALLLFITNIISINLAGVIVFSLLGVRPQNWLPETKRRIRRGVIGIVFMIIVITIPLGVIMNGIIRQTREQQRVHQMIAEHPLMENSVLIDIERSQLRGELHIIATIRSEGFLGQAAVDRIANTLEVELERPLTLEIITLPTTRSR
jgi:uncharacterized hydrophobic protein (TIGR00271 family)